MGKYTRSKCGGSRAAPPVALGARTRSRSANAALVGPGPGAAAKRRKLEQEHEAEADALPGQEACYLHLRSRKLFMPAAVAPRGDLVGPDQEAPTARLADSGALGDAAVLGISRCSSTASSAVDVDVAARETTGAEAEACESSVSDSERDGRERRETTPSSRPPVDSSSDLESSHATTDEPENPKRRRSPATTTAAFHLQPRARMPAAAEIEEFFAAAEKAQAERFAAKYNFDVALGAPLDGGRFEWTPVATTS